MGDPSINSICGRRRDVRAQGSARPDIPWPYNTGYYDNYNQNSSHPMQYYYGYEHNDMSWPTTLNSPFDFPIDLSFTRGSQYQNLFFLPSTQSQGTTVATGPQYETREPSTVTHSVTQTVTQETKPFPPNFNNPLTYFAYSPHRYTQAQLDQASSHLSPRNPPSSQNLYCEQYKYDPWSSVNEQMVTQTTDDFDDFDTSWIESLVSEPESKITSGATSSIQSSPSGYAPLMSQTSASESLITKPRLWSEVVRAGKMPSAAHTAPRSTTTPTASRASASTSPSSNSAVVCPYAALIPIPTSSTGPSTTSHLTSPSNFEEIGTKKIPEVSALGGVPVTFRRRKSVRHATAKPSS